MWEQDELGDCGQCTITYLWNAFKSRLEFVVFISTRGVSVLTCSFRPSSSSSSPSMVSRNTELRLGIMTAAMSPLSFFTICMYRSHTRSSSTGQSQSSMGFRCRGCDGCMLYWSLSSSSSSAFYCSHRWSWTQLVSFLISIGWPKSHHAPEAQGTPLILMMNCWWAQLLEGSRVYWFYNCVL